MTYIDNGFKITFDKTVFISLRSKLDNYNSLDMSSEKKFVLF